MFKNNLPKLGGVVLLSLLSLSFFFTVNEGESALVLRLGKIIGVASSDKADNYSVVYQPGLHFKIPFIDQVRFFDTRMQQLSTLASQPLTVVTKEQTYLVVEYFAKWRIDDLKKFYTSTGGSLTWAETLLEQRINDIVRAEYGKRTSDQAVSTDRINMMAAIKVQANSIGKEQGVEVMDIRIQQVTLPKDVMNSVFKRMAAERQQFAGAKRAEGLKTSTEVKALANQKVTIIEAQALMQAASIRAKGDQQAAQIYAKAYSTDPQFFAFFRSLEAYNTIFSSGQDYLVIKPEGQFFKYFHDSLGATSVHK